MRGRVAASFGAIAVVGAAALLAASGQTPPASPSLPIRGTPGAPGCTEVLVLPKPARRPDPKIEDLLSAYAAGDVAVLGRKITTTKTFDDLRKQLAPTVERWKLDRRRIQAVFLLDLADLGFQRHWYYWLDVLDLARRFVTSRPDRPGDNAAEDAFELAWHKAAASLISLSKHPEILEDCVVGALAHRIAPAAHPGTDAQLIDPWVSLVKGLAEEAWTVLHHELLRTHGLRAIGLFDEAAAFAPTRGEALVRKARLMIRLGDHGGALRALDEAGDPAADAAVRYWARLLRGQALEGVGRIDDAVRAYQETLAFAPRTQSPTVALMALSYSHDRPADALRYRDEIRSGSTNATDPWWDYDYGEGRLYLTRLNALREMGRR